MDNENTTSTLLVASGILVLGMGIGFIGNKFYTDRQLATVASNVGEYVKYTVEHNNNVQDNVVVINDAVSQYVNYTRGVVYTKDRVIDITQQALQGVVIEKNTKR